MNEDKQSSAQVRELLQQAGKRPPLPTADMAIIKAAARHEYEQMQEASSGRERHWSSWRFLAIAAVLVLAVLAGWWWKQGSAMQAAVGVATIEISNHQEAGMNVGSDIAARTRIDTRSAMAIRLAGGQSLRVAADSSLKIVSPSTIRLRRGAIYVDSDPSSRGEEIRIRTAHGVVREVGTQFEVRTGLADEPLRIRVREGEVILQTNGDSRSAAAGEEMALKSDGSVRRDRVATSGDEWAWMEELALPFALDESTLGAYVRWLARETGWRIEFADDELRQSASEIVLYGSLESVSPRESVEIALPMSGLAYRFEGDRLVILRN